MFEGEAELLAVVAVEALVEAGVDEVVVDGDADNVVEVEVAEVTGVEDVVVTLELVVVLVVDVTALEDVVVVEDVGCHLFATEVRAGVVTGVVVVAVAAGVELVLA